MDNFSYKAEIKSRLIDAQALLTKLEHLQSQQYVTKVSIEASTLTADVNDQGEDILRTSSHRSIDFYGAYFHEYTCGLWNDLSKQYIGQLIELVQVTIEDLKQKYADT